MATKCIKVAIDYINKDKFNIRFISCLLCVKNQHSMYLKM